MPIILGYWRMRGFAQPIRLMLEYAGLEYTEKLYGKGDSPDYDYDVDWIIQNDPPFPHFKSLPYIIDGEVILEDISDIMIYIAEKTGLYATSEEVKLWLLKAEGEAIDFMTKFAILAYNPAYNFKNNLYRLLLKWDPIHHNYCPNILEDMITFNDAKENFKKTYYQEMLPERVKKFADLLQESRWLLGEKISYLDFFYYEILDLHQIVYPDCLDKYPTVLQFKNRVESLEPIKKYRKSNRFIKAPLAGHSMHHIEKIVFYKTLRRGEQRFVNVSVSTRESFCRHRLLPPPRRC